MCSHATMCNRLQTSLHSSATLLAMLPCNVDRGDAHATGQTCKSLTGRLSSTDAVPAAPPAHVCTTILQPPCDYFGAQTQRSPCVMYPSYPTWWFQIFALNTCSSPTPLLLGPLAARR